MNQKKVTISVTVDESTREALKKKAEDLKDGKNSGPGMNAVAGAILDAAMSGDEGRKDAISSDMDAVYRKSKDVFAKGLDKAGNFLSGLSKNISGK